MTESAYFTTIFEAQKVVQEIEEPVCELCGLDGNHCECEQII